MKTYQRILAAAPKPRSNPIGKTAVLLSPVTAECWNLTTGEKFTLHAGQRLKVCNVNDTEHFTCLAVNEAEEVAGIDLQTKRGIQTGYRFIISNSDLRKAAPGLRPIPRKNYDVIGAIIAAES